MSSEMKTCPLCGKGNLPEARQCASCGEAIPPQFGGVLDEAGVQLLVSARREMLVAAGIWLATLVWTCGYCGLYGYHLKPEDLKFVLGFPDWVFWGVVLPWGVCTLISGWFAFFFMQDADLGDTEDAPQLSETDNAVS